MKKYIQPQVDLVKLENVDIITTSTQGTETPKYDDDDGDWTFSRSNLPSY